MPGPRMMLIVVEKILLPARNGMEMAFAFPFLMTSSTIARSSEKSVAFSLLKRWMRWGFGFASSSLGSCLLRMIDGLFMFANSNTSPN